MPGTSGERGRQLRGGPRHESAIARRPATVRERNRLLVICGSRVTERDYLRGLVDHLRNPAVSVRIMTHPCAPAQLVAYARAQFTALDGDFDEIWCVFDVDQFPDVAEAVETAAQHGIRVAVSNPCFELWLLLHFKEHGGHLATYNQVLPLLKRHVPGYDKARLRFRDYAPHWESAQERARKMTPPGDEHKFNPATGVWALTNEISQPS